MWGMVWGILILLMLALPASAEGVSGRARVVDGDTLVVAGVHLRLSGIDAPESKQICRDLAGRGWPCGARATAALETLTRGAEVRCTGDERDRYDRLLARCTAGGRDLGATLVAEGMAFAYRKYSLAYVAEEEQARAARRGIWAGRAEAPERVRAEARRVADAPGNCRIKGNISERGRLYHLPGGRAYAATRINLARGERWFCTEAEAQAAGWRAAGH